MKSLTTLFIILLSSLQSYSQITEYKYSCGNNTSTIIWTESRNGDLIHLETVQGNEVHKYVINQNYVTLSWEYLNTSENTNIKVVKEKGVYNIEGTFKSKAFSKKYTSDGYPWYQNIGFNVGHSIKNKVSFKFECIRPDNLKFYKMQADAKNTSNIKGIDQQRINVRLTGVLSKFFGSDYYIDCQTRQYITYKGVHGPPGTPETIITLKK